MNISFPLSIVVNHRNFLDISTTEEQNYVNINGLDYVLSYFLQDNKIIKGGGNSNILQLNSVTPDDLSDDDLPPEAVMKICKYHLGTNIEYEKQRIARFENEIKTLDALKVSNNVITLMASGKVKVTKEVFYQGSRKSKSEWYPYYVMEKAEYSLKHYLENYELDLLGKLELCYSIIVGLEQIQGKGYYHRDIKHDNILFVNGVWKIADLGLSNTQDVDNGIDILNEKIGPYGWLSPEVMNKVLTEHKDYILPPYDCVIDFQSDLFQLGKLFWYIFQENLPIGNICKEDFRLPDEEIFKLIKDMLEHSKARRPKKANEVVLKLEPLISKYQFL
jgi:serine/threonine protein kinase